MGETIQSGINKLKTTDMTSYALFLAGTNVTNEVLKQYDPLKTGYGRLFMVRKPLFLLNSYPDELKNFKHILEYGNTAISGLSDISVNFAQITGGYVGKSFEVPTHATDSMTQFSVTVYEFSGSPVRELLHLWINGSHDLLTGLKTYNGINDGVPTDSNGEKMYNVDYALANETAEFIYVSTDDTGENVEYACMLANCFPDSINLDVFNYQAGTHDLVSTQINFHCIKYESIQINKVAKKLIDKFRCMTNSLNMYSGISSEDAELGGQKEGTVYNIVSGELMNVTDYKKINTGNVNNISDDTVETFKKDITETISDEKVKEYLSHVNTPIDYSLKTGSTQPNPVRLGG